MFPLRFGSRTVVLSVGNKPSSNRVVLATSRDWASPSWPSRRPRPGSRPRPRPPRSPGSGTPPSSWSGPPQPPVGPGTAVDTGPGLYYHPHQQTSHHTPHTTRYGVPQGEDHSYWWDRKHDQLIPASAPLDRTCSAGPGDTWGTRHTGPSAGCTPPTTAATTPTWTISAPAFSPTQHSMFLWVFIPDGILRVYLMWVCRCW